MILLRQKLYAEKDYADLTPREKRALKRKRNEIAKDTRQYLKRLDSHKPLPRPTGYVVPLSQDYIYGIGNPSYNRLIAKSRAEKLAAEAKAAIQKRI